MLYFSAFFIFYLFLFVFLFIAYVPPFLRHPPPGRGLPPERASGRAGESARNGRNAPAGGVAAMRELVKARLRIETPAIRREAAPGAGDEKRPARAPVKARHAFCFGFR